MKPAFRLILLPTLHLLPAILFTVLSVTTLKAEVPLDQTVAAEELPQKLTAIQFLLTEDSPALIKLSLVKRTSYKLVRNRPKFYRLFIPDCQIEEEYLKLPNFPPQDFPGIRVLTSEQHNDGVEIMIGVEEGVRLSSFVQGNDIFLRSSLQ